MKQFFLMLSKILLILPLLPFLMMFPFLFSFCSFCHCLNHHHHHQSSFLLFCLETIFSFLPLLFLALLFCLRIIQIPPFRVMLLLPLLLLISILWSQGLRHIFIKRSTSFLLLSLKTILLMSNLLFLVTIIKVLNGGLP